MMSFAYKALGLNLVFSLFAAAHTHSTQLPIVDLGYELHQAISYEEHIGIYNFSNIRFAAAPVGDLRFRAPAPPIVNRTTAQTGSEARICPQALPSWMPQSMSNAISYVTNGSITSMGPVLMDPRANEDCLFLDVVVPKKIFETSGKKRKGAPVLVWIYGGGYTGGSKSGQGSGSPVGLLRRGDNEFVYVAINYRLGAFGWLSGSTFQQNGAANAGLLDQRFALEWVQQYIHLFGGDPKRVMDLDPTPGVFNPLIALQQLITSFTLTGKPATDLASHVPMYGRENALFYLNATGIGMSREDPRVMGRCEEWYHILDTA
ncbi:lipase 1 [Aspergillus udagawae]|nr:lipase 1 [Aspergillus udagawae]